MKIKCHSDDLTFYSETHYDESDELQSEVELSKNEWYAFNIKTKGNKGQIKEITVESKDVLDVKEEIFNLDGAENEFTAMMICKVQPESISYLSTLIRWVE